MTYLHRIGRAALAMTVAAAVIAPAAASAQTADDYVGQADGTGVAVDLLGLLDVTAGTTTAGVDSGPAATATGTGFGLLDESISTITITDGSLRDPVDAAEQNCATAILPAPLADVLPLGCSSAAGMVTGAGPSAAAQASVADINVGADQLVPLVDAIVDLGVLQIAGTLDGALQPVTDLTGELLGPVSEQLAELCVGPLADVIGVLVDLGLLDAPGDLAELTPGALGTLLEQVDGLLAVGQALPQACAELVTLIADPPSLQDLTEAIEATLRAAIDGLSLLQISLGSSTSGVSTTATTVTATATSTGLSVTIPALGDLTDAINQIISAALTDLVSQLSPTLASSLDITIPTVSDLLADVLADLDLPDIVNTTDPLLSLVVADSSAEAVLDRASGAVTTSGTGSIITLDLADVIGGLVGIPAGRIEVPLGQSQMIDLGPLGLLTLGAGSFDLFAGSIDGIVTTGARASGVTLSLTGSTLLPGDITLLGVGAEAQVGSTVIPAQGAPPVSAATPPPARDLPRTGGSAPLAVLAGMMLLAGLGLAASRRQSGV